MKAVKRFVAMVACHLLMVCVVASCLFGLAVAYVDGSRERSSPGEVCLVLWLDLAFFSFIAVIALGLWFTIKSWRRHNSEF